MRTEQLTVCLETLQKLRFRLGPLNRVKPPIIYITDHSKMIPLILFSVRVACFVVASVLFSPSMCLDNFS